ITDDQDLVRAGLKALLTNDPEIEVIAEASNGADALRAVRDYRPDVVLMDIRMPGGDGITATRAVCGAPNRQASRALMLTTFDDDEDILDAISAGAAGYLLKDISSEDLRQSVKAVAEGANLLSPTSHAK